MKRTGKRASKRAAQKKDPPMQSAAPSSHASTLSSLCLDPSKPAEVRAKILLDVLQSNEEPTLQQAVLTDLLRKSGPEAEVARLMEHYEQALAELEHGALRPATFLALVEEDLPGPRPRAHVIAPDGQERFPTLHPRLRPDTLSVGATVFLDPKGSVVLGVSASTPRVGQEGIFLRLVPGTSLLEVQLQGERLILHSTASVLAAATAGSLGHGDRVLVCPRRHVALDVVPRTIDHRHRFLDRSRVPDVVAERDIGQPHWILDYLVRRLRLLLFRPDLLSQFDLRPRCSVLLTGPTGCGKTLTIRAFLREFDRLLVECSGRTDLGSRVIRVRVAELLSEWLGRTDKNVEELFDDVRSVAAAPVKVGGQSMLLPVVVILEEVEGIARRRGGQDAAVYDRILATLLQRLDDPTDDLAQLPLVLISTSNRPDLIDSAMCRRLGLQARFTRLDRDGLAAVLDKKLKPSYPYPPVAGRTPAEVRTRVLAEVVEALFDSGEDAHALIEVTLRGGRKLVKRRRDFLTGGLVEQAVATAIDRTVAAAADCAGLPGLSAKAVREALRQHIDALADNLTADNAADYLDLPENARVAAVRRLRPGGTGLPYLLSDLDN